MRGYYLGSTRTAVASRRSASPVPTKPAKSSPFSVTATSARLPTLNRCRYVRSSDTFDTMQLYSWRSGSAGLRIRLSLCLILSSSVSEARNWTTFPFGGVAMRTRAGCRPRSGPALHSGPSLGRRAHWSKIDQSLRIAVGRTSLRWTDAVFEPFEYLGCDGWAFTDDSASWQASVSRRTPEL